MQFAEHFRGKGCVVTGAASGIGLAIGEALLNAGAAVVLADSDTTTLAQAAKRLGAHGARMQPVSVDVTSRSQVQRLVTDATARHGRLDFMFNNAGIGGTLPIGEATPEHWRRIVDVNLWGVIHGVDAALPLMRRQKGGHIVNTSSIGGLVPVPFQSLYNTTKYAIVGLSESLRYELADEGIRVSVLCPGAVATAIWGKPIIGPAVDATPPADAVSAEEAAAAALAGVAAGQGIIALPDAMRDFWRCYCESPDAFESVLSTMARQRRARFAAAQGEPEAGPAARATVGKGRG